MTEPGELGKLRQPFRFELALLLVLVFAGVAIRLYFYLGSHWSVGDALICFRFGEQFAAGNGLVFNTGQKISANTTLLYTFLLGIGGKLGLSIPVFARILGIACDVGTFTIILRLLRGPDLFVSPISRYSVAAVGFLFPLLAMYSICGMETSLYTCLVFFLLLQTMTGPGLLYYLAAALVVFCRPDGVIVIGATVLYLTFQTGKIPWKEVAGLACVGLLYIAINFFYYGSVFPYSVKVKAFFYHNTWQDNFRFIAARFFRGMPAFAIFLGLCAAGTVWLRRIPVVRLLSVTTGMLLIYLVIVAPGLRSYYLVPFIYLGLLICLITAASFLEKTVPHKLPVLATLAGLLYMAGLVVLSPRMLGELQKLRAYEKATREDPGLWLARNTPPDCKVFVTALETGYYAKRQMLDSPGLITPEVLAALKKKPLDYFEQAELVRADYMLVPSIKTNGTGPFRLLAVYSYGQGLSEFEAMSYGLYARQEGSN